MVSSNEILIACSLVLALVLSSAHSWNTCDDELFCRTIRYRNESNTTDFETTFYQYDVFHLNLGLWNSKTQRSLILMFTAHENGVIRISSEVVGDDRYRPSDSLAQEPPLLPMEYVSSFNYLVLRNSRTSINISIWDVTFNVFHDDVLIMRINARDFLTHNHILDHADEAVALDFSFVGAERAYGIPEHAERLSLQWTRPGGLNPYRLYNVDYPAYPIGTQEALYGSVNVLYSHNTSRTSGIFWMNAAQTFVDVDRNDEGVEAVFISEAGEIDLFILPGPTLPDAVKQYTNLTGTAPLPQYFALGHHQSRWSYMSQEDVETVVAEFDNHDFPLDVIWLDIDYTDSFKYFTWNLETFPNPVGMAEYINSTGRKMVLIIDPHYKVEEGYHIFDVAHERGYFVRNPNGTDFQGYCWPGLSSYIDYFDSNASDWYSEQFSVDNFPNGTDILYIWNDMNEPSVFDIEEKTFPRDLVHVGTIPHREVHNQYGFTQTRATHKGLYDRYGGRKRPFVLTRSHFAGSQRYTAVWTGDNVASWEHLRISFSMCLTLSISGISFCGADVGGFLGIVDEELFMRWYQAGAWLPFYRAHSAQDVPRREPYLYPPEVQERFRNAMAERYAHLPMWYTTFYEHERYGDPVMRPMTYHYQDDPNLLDMDNQWFIGENILVCPVSVQGAATVQIYFPGGFDQTWFDIKNFLLYRGIGYYTVPVDIDSVPVFYKGGSIIFQQETRQASSQFMHDDPYNVYIFMGTGPTASGNLYHDDFESFDYRNGVYNYFKFSFDAVNGFTVDSIDLDAYYERLPVIGTIYLFSSRAAPTRVQLVKGSEERDLDVEVQLGKHHVKITNLNVKIEPGMKIKLS